MSNIPENLKMFTTLGKAANEKGKVVDFPKTNDGQSFKNFLMNARDDLQKAEEMATGKMTGKPSVSMIDAVASIAEAEVSLSVAKASMDKAIAAFKEVQGMQM